MASPFVGTYLPPLLDDFNRANGPLVAPWTGPGWGLGVLAVISSQCGPDASTDYHAMYYDYPAGSVASAAQVITYSSLGGGSGIELRDVGFMTWYNDGTHTGGYHLAISTTGYKLYRKNDDFNSSGFTVLIDAPASVTYALNDLIGAWWEVISGHVVLTMYRSTGGGAWTQTATYTDLTPGFSIGPWFAGVTLYGGSGSNPNLLDNYRMSDGSDGGSTSSSVMIPLGMPVRRGRV